MQQRGVPTLREPQYHPPDGGRSQKQRLVRKHPPSEIKKRDLILGSVDINELFILS